MKKISKVWYLVVALVVLGVAAYFLGKPDTKETISFDTATVGQTNIQNSITATGTIEPVTSVTKLGSTWARSSSPPSGIWRFRVSSANSMSITTRS